jgi:hypothetical protein
MKRENLQKYAKTTESDILWIGSGLRIQSVKTMNRFYPVTILQCWYAPLRSPEFRRFFLEFRDSAGIIEICIFQKFLPFPVFLVDNLNFYQLFFNFPCQANIRRIFEETLKS